MEQKPTTAEKKAVYDAARAAQFGNVHERMKFLACALMKAKKDHGELFDKHPALMEFRDIPTVARRGAI